MNNEIVPGFDDEKNDSITIRLQRMPDIERGLIVHASGYIDTYNSIFFQKRVEKVIEAGFVKILFEMSAVNYISSAGYGSFTYFLKLVKPRNGDVVMQGLQEKVYEVAQLLGLSQFFVTRDSLDESMEYLANLDSPAFPRIFTCPVCAKRLRAGRPGRFRCGECKTVLVIGHTTQVTLG